MVGDRGWRRVRAPLRVAFGELGDFFASLLDTGFRTANSFAVFIAIVFFAIVGSERHALR